MQMCCVPVTFNSPDPVTPSEWLLLVVLPLKASFAMGSDGAATCHRARTLRSTAKLKTGIPSPQPLAT